MKSLNRMTEDSQLPMNSGALFNPAAEVDASTPSPGLTCLIAANATNCSNNVEGKLLRLLALCVLTMLICLTRGEVRKLFSCGFASIAVVWMVQTGRLVWGGEKIISV